METVTLQGPVVVLPEAEYRTLLNRLTRLETMVVRLAQVIEDFEDVQIMRESEEAYRVGDSIAFADLLAEVQADNNDVSG
jgi:hypothetical protein